MLQRLDQCFNHLGYATIALGEIRQEVAPTHPDYAEALAILEAQIEKLAITVGELREVV